jgi:hypothetical protein
MQSGRRNLSDSEGKSSLGNFLSIDGSFPVEQKEPAEGLRDKDLDGDTVSRPHFPKNFRMVDGRKESARACPGSSRYAAELGNGFHKEENRERTRIIWYVLDAGGSDAWLTRGDTVDKQKGTAVRKVVGRRGTKTLLLP